MKNVIGFILAAGYNKRLKEHTKDLPKSFLEIKGKKIINYHLENLSNLGVKKVYIVVGFLKSLFKETLGNTYNDIEITYIDNDDFEISGHSFSLYLGKDTFKQHDIILIHADVFCDPFLYEIALKSKNENVVLVDKDYRVLTGDEFVVTGEDEIVTGIGPDKKENIRGEFLGLSKFSSDFMVAFCDFMENFFISKGRQYNYEIVMDEFLKLKTKQVNYENIGDRKWININYIEDYKKANEIAQNLK